jgi:DNA-binding transcriptional LysR family regulator
VPAREGLADSIESRSRAGELDLSYKRSVMQTIPITHGDEPSLQQLRVFDGLLREHSLTHAARELGITQPALSKSLAQLRRYFDDPLFVRTGFRMEPTPKALQLQAPVRAILDRAASLRSESALFEPRTSHRTFNFSVVDAGLLKLLPPLVERLLAEAPNVRLQVLQPDAAHLERWLESGKLDFAMGSFPSMPKSIRRQPLGVEHYVSVVRCGHPRLSVQPTMRAFAAEKHVLVSLVGSGHAHQIIQRTLEAAIPRENVVCKVPIFIGAAVLAKHTDAIATLPASVATVLAKDLDLQIIAPPIRLPRIDILQYWHERFHRDPGSQWIRSVFRALFRKV